jgi:hypothetical protein
MQQAQIPGITFSLALLALSSLLLRPARTN